MHALIGIGVSVSNHAALNAPPASCTYFNCMYQYRGGKLVGEAGLYLIAFIEAGSLLQLPTGVLLFPWLNLFFAFRRASTKKGLGFSIINS